MEQSQKRRIQILDLIRTIAMVFMVVHHTCYDLAVFSVIPFSYIQGLALRIVSYISAALFMLCSGVSSRLSRSNIKRGAWVLMCALVVSIVTRLMGRPVLFGILHFFGTSMILYGIFEKPLIRALSLLSSIGKVMVPLVCIICFILSDIFTSKAETNLRFLFPLGFTADGFFSSDYYPLLPWIFLFLAGTWIGGLVLENRDKQWLYVPVPKALTFPGQHSLLIYMVHQPVIYFAVMGLSKLLGK